MKNAYPVIPVIVGPTASGKSSLAHSLALRHGWEILSCDSRQLYKGMDIGTAKPTSKQLGEVVYHGIDTLSPTEEYSAAHWASDALTTIKDIFGRGKQPIIVGGTLFYLQALQKGIEQTQEQNSEFRKQCHQREEASPGSLHKELQLLNTDRANKLHPHDIHRIIRALAVALDAEQTFEETSKPPPYTFVSIVLAPDRADLYDRINTRVDQMVSSGLVEEFNSLVSQGYTCDTPGLKSVGYQEFFKYIEKELTLKETLAKVQQNSRKYAKRQATWLRNKFEANKTIESSTLTQEAIVEEANLFLQSKEYQLF